MLPFDLFKFYFLAKVKFKYQISDSHHHYQSIQSQMQISEQFFANTLKKFPNLQHLISIAAHKKNRFILNYPIEIQQQKQVSQSATTSKINYILKNGTKPISNNNYVFLYPVSNAFTSMNFQGAKLAQIQKLNDSIQKLKQTQIQSGQFLNNLKIMIQICAADAQLKKLSQKERTDQNAHPLKMYGNYLCNQSKQLFSQPYVDQKTANCIGSIYLKNLATSQPKELENYYKHTKELILKKITLQEFISIERMIRAKRAHLDMQVKSQSSSQDEIQVVDRKSIMAPFLDFFQHSFQPNCKITGLYMTHLRQSFLSIKTVRDIQPGEPLTFSRGNINNYEMFFRYGKIDRQNPNRQSYIIIALEKVPQIFQQQKQGLSIQWKQDMLLQMGQKMKSIIKVRPNGQINQKDYKILQILFAKQKEDYYSRERRNQILKKKIYNFIHNEAILNLQFIKKNLIKNSENGNLIKLSHPEIDYLQNEQIENVQNFIQKSREYL